MKKPFICLLVATSHFTCSFLDRSAFVRRAAYPSLLTEYKKSYSETDPKDCSKEQQNFS
jgi:hypothetical protein